ncbi:hypothetical protein BJY52DRAFT_1294814 [Lactarius psammicola]|nr:hypothetical protein BJY52DRAFT_1294814 [Lactarius psammicola]
MASKLLSLYLLAVVSLGVVNAAPLDVRKPNQAQCNANQKKVASDLQNMGDALNQLSAEMNLGNATDMSLAANGTAECPPALNATAADACNQAAADKAAKKGKKGNKAVDLANAADMNNATAVNATAECPPGQDAAACAAANAKGAKGKKAKPADLANAADKNNAATPPAVNATEACMAAANASPEACAAKGKGAKGKKVKAADAANADPAAADKNAAKGAKGKGKNAAGDAAAMDLANSTQVMDNAMNMNSTAADNSTALADCGLAGNATAMDACNMANNMAMNDTAAGNMNKAMSHVKNAKDALAQMMAGDKGANMDQINGNITLAAGEMDAAMMKSNATGKDAKSAMSKVKSMAHNLQMDAKAMGDACASA